MASVKVQQPDLAQHHCSIMVQMREFWREGYLCDVVIKSRDGTEHRAHATVLCASSIVLKTLIGGPFCEADQVQRGQPIEISASDASVVALLDYIYGGQPEMPVEESIELLRLADAYNLPQLAEAVEAGLRDSLKNAPAATALKVLQQSQGLHRLKAACADQVALNFDACAQHPDFLQLSPAQVGQILRRDDLNVLREDAVLQSILRWLNHSKDRDPFSGVLMTHVDFQSISFQNLVRIDRFAASIGQRGGDLQLEVDQALNSHKRRSSGESADQIHPKRRCLNHWSPDLGASSTGGRQVLSRPCFSLRWHEGSIYGTTWDTGSSSVLCWKPGESDPRVVAGHGARVAGVNDLGKRCVLFVTLAGEIFVRDSESSRIISFANGSGQLIAQFAGIPFVSPNGVVYSFSNSEKTLQKLVGTTFQAVTDPLSFEVKAMFVTEEEVCYLADDHARIWRISPSALEPALVGAVTGGSASLIIRLFVTKEGKIYACDQNHEKFWAFHPGDTTCIEVLQCPEGFKALDIVAHDRSLYVAMYKQEKRSRVGGIYEYLLPPELRLE